MQRGQQKRIRAFSVPQQSYHLVGAYHWRTDQVFSQAFERKVSQTFIQLLEYLLVVCFPTRKIVLVMDNASYHHSKTVQAALSLFEPRVRVFWQPKYCPTLKPIERFWLHLNDLACASKLELSLENLADRVETMLGYQNSDDHVLEMALLKNYV